MITSEMKCRRTDSATVDTAKGRYRDITTGTVRNFRIRNCVHRNYRVFFNWSSENASCPQYVPTDADFVCYKCAMQGAR